MILRSRIDINDVIFFCPVDSDISVLVDYLLSGICVFSHWFKFGVLVASFISFWVFVFSIYFSKLPLP